jgi:WXG100 family type VII secretion target
MTARIVRANYDELAKVAGVFDQQAALTESVLEDLCRQLETLRGGDWLGQGANAFYAEMDSQVVPTLGRLSRALGQAADTARQISQSVQEAENQAAVVFKSNAAVGAPVGATVAFGVAGTGGTAETGAGTPAGAAGFTTTTAAAAPAATSAAANTLRPSEAFLTSFGSENRALIEKSPTLLRELAVLESVGWHVFHVQSPPNPPLTKLDRAHKEILIGTDKHAGSQVMSLALEIGRYLGPDRSSAVVAAGMTKDDYVRMNVNEDLIAEGSRWLNLEIVNNEMSANGVGAVSHPNEVSHQEFVKIWRIAQNYVRNQLNRDQAVHQIADVLGAHVPENGKISVWDAKAQWFARQWDNIAKDQGWTH